MNNELAEKQQPPQYNANPQKHPSISYSNISRAASCTGTQIRFSTFSTSSTSVSALPPVLRGDQSDDKASYFVRKAVAIRQGRCRIKSRHDPKVAHLPLEWTRDLRGPQRGNAWKDMRDFANGKTREERKQEVRGKNH
jgi:hypothetical protein